MTSTLPATRDYQRAHVGLRALTYRDVAVLWRLLEPTRLDATFTVFAAAVLHLIGQRRAVSVALARAYLEECRAGVPGEAPPVPDPELAIPAVLISLRVTAVISIKVAMTRGEGLELATRNALVRTMGAVDKWVGDGGRELIRASVDADPAAIGWRRATLGTCQYCGKEAAEAGVQSGSADFPRHDHCGCSPEPVYVEVETELDVESATMTVAEVDELVVMSVPLNPERVAALYAEYKRGKAIEPLQLERSPRGGAPFLTDGHHRLEAARQAGRTEIPVLIYAATPEGRLAALRALTAQEAAKDARDAYYDATAAALEAQSIASKRANDWYDENESFDPLANLWTEYQSFGYYEDIQETLRGSGAALRLREEFAELFVEAGYTTTRPMIVHRGILDVETLRLGGVGSMFVDRGVISTTATVKHAQAFIMYQLQDLGPLSAPRNVMILEIHVPAGTRVVGGYEMEMMLAPGSKFRITRIERDIIAMELVP